MAIVRSRSQEQLVFEERTDLSECFYKLVVFAERGGENIARFIDDQQVPRELCLRTAACRIGCVARGEELLQNVGLAEVIVGSDDTRVRSPRIGIKADSALESMRFRPIDEVKS